MYPVHITDHAVLRYIERVYGINIDDVRREILSIEDYEKYRQFKDCNIKRDNCVLIIRDCKVVTVLAKDMENKHFIKKRDYEKAVHKRKRKNGK